MPGDLFPTVELNSFSGQPWSSKSIVGQEHLYLFWNSSNAPSRLLIRSLQGLSNNPKGCDLTCLNVAEPGSIDAEPLKKASETFCASRSGRTSRCLTLPQTSKRVPSERTAVASLCWNRWHHSGAMGWKAPTSSSRDYEGGPVGLSRTRSGNDIEYFDSCRPRIWAKAASVQEN